MNKEELESQIQTLIDLAKTDSNKNEIMTFEGNTEILEQMSNQFGKDLSDYTFQVDIYAIRHILRNTVILKKKKVEGKLLLQTRIFY
jgi:hypothetical protein